MGTNSVANAVEPAENHALYRLTSKNFRLESGAMMRLDSTVTSALMHESSDSTLLSDAVWVMTRLLQRGEALPGPPARSSYCPHWRTAAADRRRWWLRQRANLAVAKARGVADVAFHKKCGIAITEMVKSSWVYRRLRNFRAGIEAAISCFKRAYGAYIWSAVVAHNLVLFARLKPA
jgi:hypothetical protein